MKLVPEYLNEVVLSDFLGTRKRNNKIPKTKEDLLKQFEERPPKNGLEYIKSGYSRDSGHYSKYKLGEIEIEASYDKFSDEIFIHAWNPVQKIWYNGLNVENASTNLKDTQFKIQDYFDNIQNGNNIWHQ
jgi:hypothetical protein